MHKNNSVNEAQNSRDVTTETLRAPEADGATGLLPCPFCDGPATISGDAYKGFQVGCNSQTCKVNPVSDNDWHDVKYSKAEWNTRANSHDVLGMRNVALRLALGDSLSILTLIYHRERSRLTDQTRADLYETIREVERVLETKPDTSTDASSGTADQD